MYGIRGQAGRLRLAWRIVRGFIKVSISKSRGPVEVNGCCRCVVDRAGVFTGTAASHGLLFYRAACRVNRNGAECLLVAPPEGAC